jgi:membrane protease subunit (stomatin/prohibitin family)
MGLFDTLRNEFIDIIECTDDASDIILWKFPRYENEITDVTHTSPRKRTIKR